MTGHDVLALLNVDTKLWYLPLSTLIKTGVELVPALLGKHVIDATNLRADKLIDKPDLKKKLSSCRCIWLHFDADRCHLDQGLGLC